MDQTLETLPTLIDLSHELQSNLMISLIMVTVPGLCVISGAFLFGVGIPVAVASYTMAGVVGMANAMLPVFRRRLETKSGDN